MGMETGCLCHLHKGRPVAQGPGDEARGWEQTAEAEALSFVLEAAVVNQGEAWARTMGSDCKQRSLYPSGEFWG